MHPARYKRFHGKVAVVKMREQVAMGLSKKAVAAISGLMQRLGEFHDESFPTLTSWVGKVRFFVEISRETSLYAAWATIARNTRSCVMALGELHGSLGSEELG